MNTLTKENKMGIMPENKLLLSMSVPMMLSMLIQALYNIIDGLFVAGISPEQFELTAVNLAYPAQNLMIAVSVGTGVGINALISRNLGLGDVSMLYRWQEYYSNIVEDVARSSGCPIIDLRGEFLRSHNYKRLISNDGIHPTAEGHKLARSVIERYSAELFA